MKKFRPRPTYANVVATLALFVALGGSAYAAAELPENSVGTKELKTEAVTTAKIKDGAVTEDQILDGAVTGAKVKEGTLGTVPRADLARTAGDAGTLNGLTAAQIKAASKLHCPKAAPRRIAGFCTEATAHSKATYQEALTDCARADMALPSFGEAAAIVATDKKPSSEAIWAGSPYREVSEDGYFSAPWVSWHPQSRSVNYGVDRQLWLEQFHCVTLPTN